MDNYLNKEFLKNEFAKIFGDCDGVSMFFSPGRVNLIGEHVDYNGGLVFPCALDIGTMAVARRSRSVNQSAVSGADNKCGHDGKKEYCPDRILKLASLNYGDRYDISLDDLVYRPENQWANYLVGVAREFVSMGYELGGLEMLIAGNIPSASGLSSSASIELLTCVTLNGLFNHNGGQIRAEVMDTVDKTNDISMLDMVKLSQRAENNFCGVNCGIMDQFAVGFGKKDHAMLLDCSSLEFEYIPIKLGDYKLVIGNTNKRRELADSKYNERRAECDEAVRIFNEKRVNSITLLSEISIEEFERDKHLIENELVRKRAEHVVYEIHRTKEASERLKAGDIKAFGLLMNESHESLKTLYEVSGRELDAMVEEAQNIEGVIGSRMTGAGFGGCTISIVHKNAIDYFTTRVGAGYERRTGLKADFIIAGIGDGAGVVG